MKSDWHRYNLKRRVASLPPLSSEVFADKVVTAQASTNAAAAKASFERSCAACQKTYYSENAYQNHIGSQKHKLRFAAWKKGGHEETGSMVSSAFSLGEPINGPSTQKRDPEAEAEFEKVVDGLKETSIQDKDPLSRRPSRPHHSSNEERPEHPLSETTTETSTPSGPSEPASTPQQEYPLSRCLFCNYDSPTWQLSVGHMTRIHNMFIPEQNYLTDMEGLIRYFQAKVVENHECLYCHKLKGTTAGIQTHMRDKGHCMIAFETEEEMIEVGQFYDFSSTYSDPEDDDDTASEGTAMHEGVKLPRGDGDEEMDEGWETDSSASSLDSDELAAVPIDDHTHQYQKLPLHRHHSHHDPRPHRNADGFHSHAHLHAHAVFHSEYELHLPSGRTAGHRSLSRYFRQNLHNHPSPEEREIRRQAIEAAAPPSDDEDEVMADDDGPSNETRTVATRNAGMLGATASQKKDVKAAEKRGRRTEQRERNRYQAKVEKQNNSQKHFRVSLASNMYRPFYPLTNYRILCFNDLFIQSRYGSFRLQEKVSHSSVAYGFGWCVK